MKKLQDIESVDWSPKLGEIGAVVEDTEDIDQCIGIILATPKGSDPHRPAFGSDIWQYLDRPMSEAVPGVIQEAITALSAWEPRVEVVKIVAAIEESQVTFSVEWKRKETSATNTLEVTV